MATIWCWSFTKTDSTTTIWFPTLSTKPSLTKNYITKIKILLLLFSVALKISNLFGEHRVNWKKRDTKNLLRAKISTRQHMVFTFFKFVWSYLVLISAEVIW